MQTQNMTCYCQGHGNRARARALTSGDGKKKYGHSPVECSKAKIRSTAGNILGKIKARGYLPAGSSRCPARFIPCAKVVYRVVLKAPGPDETA